MMIRMIVPMPMYMQAPLGGSPRSYPTGETDNR